MYMHKTLSGHAKNSRRTQEELGKHQSSLCGNVGKETDQFMSYLALKIEKYMHTYKKEMNL